MSEKTKIVVVHMKELLYTVIFTALVIILIIVLVYMFLPKSGDEAAPENPVQTEINATESVSEITENAAAEFLPETDTGMETSVPLNTEEVTVSQ